MKCYKLEPVGVFQKSFYGKAQIIECDGISYLQSYDTIVAYIDEAGRFFRTWGGWSATTAKHINSFCNLFNVRGYCKKDWDALPVKNLTIYRTLRAA